MTLQPFAAPSAASNNSANTSTSSIRAPSMTHHAADEFRFAYRTLNKMVLNSELFPMRAEEDDWFCPRELVVAKKNTPTDQTTDSPCTTLTKSMEEQRRPSMESTATASTSSVTSSVGCSSPIVVARRHTVDCDIDLMMMASAMEKLSLPLSSDLNSTHDDNTDTAAFTDLIKSKVDVDSVQANRRASVDNAHLMIRAPSEPELKANDEEYSTVPSVQEKDIDYGAILGKGGFCEVRLVTLKADKEQEKKGASTSRQQYAMKYLSPTRTITSADDSMNKISTGRDKAFERGIADLAIEARFLALLSHENIIRVHYISEGTLEEQFNCKEVECDYRHRFGYFVLLDPLAETLASRIEDRYIPSVFNNGGATTTVVPVSSSSSGRGSSSWWKKMMPNRSTNSESNNMQLESWKAGLTERLEGLKGVASALQYLHDECNVIYRDIKPDNIGFYRKPHPHCHCGKRCSSHSVNKQDDDGCTCYTEIPQLFDFGLAKELKPKYLQAHPHHPAEAEVNTYNLTARSGSRRYMAPEVAFGHPYNEKADVYSFGIVLYQVASLIMPFDGYSLYQHTEEVLNCGGRPNVSIPSTKKTMSKIKKSSVSNHDQWQGMKDDDKKIKHLGYRTKCVWTRNLKVLLEECWHADMRSRPSMKDVVERLDTCITELARSQPNDQADVAATSSLQDKQTKKVVHKSIGCLSTRSESSIVDGCVTAQ